LNTFASIQDIEPGIKHRLKVDASQIVLHLPFKGLPEDFIVAVHLTLVGDTLQLLRYLVPFSVSLDVQCIEALILYKIQRSFRQQGRGVRGADQGKRPVVLGILKNG